MSFNIKGNMNLIVIDKDSKYQQQCSFFSFGSRYYSFIIIFNLIDTRKGTLLLQRKQQNRVTGDLLQGIT